MNIGLVRRIVIGYSIGLAVTSLCVWLAYLLGHAVRGVPTSLLWGAALSASVLALPHADPNWRRQTPEYVVQVVALLLLGSALVGLVILTPFRWAGGARWATVDVVLASVLAAGVSIFGRTFGRWPPRDAGEARNS